MISYNIGDSMADCVENIESFYFFIQGKKREINKTNKEFNEMLSKIEHLFSISRVMPAFGVSLNEETQNALKEGEWIQVNFDKEMNKNNLPFNALLFKLETTSGINLIRLYENKYEGRCIFLDFIETIDLKQFML